MELDDMKRMWQSLDQHLARQNALDLALLREQTLASAQRRLRPLWLGQWLQIALGVLVVLGAAKFWYAHLGQLHLVVSGALLHIYGVLIIIAAGCDLQLNSRLGYNASVTTIQEDMLRYRQWRIRTSFVFVVISCFAWVPMTLVAFEALFGADIYAHAPEVMWILLASGCLCLGLMLSILSWARRPGHERLAAWLRRSAVGESLTRAQMELDKLAEFAR